MRLPASSRPVFEQGILTTYGILLPCRCSSVVEQRFCKPPVVGSSPTIGSSRNVNGVSSKATNGLRRFLLSCIAANVATSQDTISIMNKYQIFGSPTLLSHLATQLHQRWCAITKEENLYFLYSSDIEYLCSSNGSKSKRRFDGLLEIFNLPSSHSNAPAGDETICVGRLLTILNGAIKFKYKEGNGLSRGTISPSSVTTGVIKREQGIQATRTIPVRVHLARPLKEYQDADKQPPKLKNIWREARRNPIIARACYYYGQPSDMLNLRKVIEEIAGDTYKGKPTTTSLVNNWIQQKWTEPEIPVSRMFDVWHYLHNSYISEEGLHAIGQSSKLQANALQAPLTSSDVRDAVHIIFTKWIISKVR